MSDDGKLYRLYLDRLPPGSPQASGMWCAQPDSQPARLQRHQAWWMGPRLARLYACRVRAVDTTGEVAECWEAEQTTEEGTSHGYG